MECAFRSVGLDYREFVKVVGRTEASQQVGSGLCGNPRKAETELGWKREWSFERTIGDIVSAEIEERPEYARADPSPPSAKHNIRNQNACGLAWTNYLARFVRPAAWR